MATSTPATDRLIGQVLAERYQILELLGEGGMGRVYLAEHVRIGRRSAVKVMSPDMARTADGVARFNREAANAARINHPNVAQIYDFGETSDGTLYLAMEFVEGETLRQIIQRRGPMAPARAAALTKQIADALEAAHHLGIVHRDLKPDNIMVARRHDGSDWVKVVDFGIAKTVQGDDDDERRSQTLTTAGVSLGTPEYMSPEQLAGERLAPATDQYALGLVLFNMLTAKLPYPELTSRETLVARLTSKPQTLLDVVPGIAWPPALQAALNRALAPKVANRYASVTEFALDVALASASFDPYATPRVANAATVVSPTDATVRIETATKPVSRKRLLWLAPLVAGGVVLLSAVPYREQIVPYTQKNFPYAADLAASGMTRARRAADAVYGFYRFYQKPSGHVATSPVADTQFVDSQVVDTPFVGTTAGTAPSGAMPVALQGMTTPELTRDSQPASSPVLSHAGAGSSTPDSTTLAKPSAAAATDSVHTTNPPDAHSWLRANGDSGEAQPLPANATDADRIHRLGDELRGHAIRANQFMSRGDVPRMRAELHDLTSEAQVFRVLYPAVADSIHLDQLLRAARGRVYQTCQTMIFDKSFPPNFTCGQVIMAGNGGRFGGANGQSGRPPA
jgi:serine/threonine protein kinase